MPTVKLWTFPDTMAAAARVRALADREPFDARRAIDGTSIMAIISMAVLVDQLDVIVKAAARAEDAWRRAYVGEIESTEAAAASDELIRLLTASAYLPLPATPETEEAAHGAR